MTRFSTNSSGLRRAIATNMRSRKRARRHCAPTWKIAGQNSEASPSLVQLRELEQQSAALATLYQTFLARYEEASQQRSFPIAKARVISEAANPTSASSPRKAMVLGLSLVLGLFAGAGAGALQEFRERFFRTGDDVRTALDINFLGYLPIISTGLSRAAQARPADAGDQPQQGLTETVTRAFCERRSTLLPPPLRRRCATPRSPAMSCCMGNNAKWLVSFPCCRTKARRRSQRISPGCWQQRR